MMQQRPARPLGVVLSAFALGAAALVLLLLSVGGLAAALGGAHLVMMLGVVPIYLALAAWAMATLIGLLRMRSWARVSSMVITGCMAGFGLLFAASLMAMQSAVASGAIPVPPIATPADIHRAFTAMGWLCLVLSVVGLAGLVYFARRSTRDAFLRAQTQDPLAPAAVSPGVPHARPSGPAWAARSQTAPDPLTDFTVARPIEPVTHANAAAADSASEVTLSSDAVQQPWPSPVAGPHQAPLQASAWPASSQNRQDAQALPEGTTRVRIRRPTSVTIVAVVLLANAFFTLVGIVSPVPGFLFGMAVSGWALHLYSVVWSTAAAIAGLGMLRLQRPAWRLSFVLLGLSSLQFLLLLLPSARARYLRYMTDLQPHSGLGSPQGIPAGMLSTAILLSVLLGLVVLVLFAVMLWRARWAFEAALPAEGEELPLTKV